MNEEHVIPEPGESTRSLKNWTILAEIRKQVSDNPEDLAQFREDPIKALREGGFDFDEPLSGPGIHGLTLKEIMAKMPELATMLPNIVTAGQDSVEATSNEWAERTVSSTEAAIAVANSNANGNANGNANANANTNTNTNGTPEQKRHSVDMRPQAKQGAMWAGVKWPDGGREKLLNRREHNFHLLKLNEARVAMLVERIANDPTRKLYEVGVVTGVREGFEHRHGQNIVEVRVHRDEHGTRLIESANVRPA
jgi:hypothetical protein